MPLLHSWCRSWRHFWRAALAACLLLMLMHSSTALAEEAQEAPPGEDVAARVAKLEAEIAALRIMVGALEAAVRARPSLVPGGESPDGSDELVARVGALDVQIDALTKQLDKFEARLDEVSGAKTAKASPSETKPAEAKPAEKKTPAPKPTEKTTPEKKTAEVNPEPRPNQDTTQKAAPPKEAAPPPAPKRKPPIVEAKREVKPEPEPEPQDEDVPVPPSLAPVVPPAGQIADPSKPRWYGLPPETNTDAATPTTTGALPAKPPQRKTRIAAYPAKEAQALYEEGYGDYLRRDYAGAEAAFRELVAAHPNDPLAGSAQYWVGETLYLRKEYKKAADSFLAGYRKYSGSDKAADTLLRLGMSLAALGETEAACSAFKKLDNRFPDAPQTSDAKSAGAKAGCK